MSILDNVEEDYAEYIGKVKEATSAFEDAVKGAKDSENGLHEIGTALTELKSVVRFAHPGALTKEPSPSLDPDHPQGLGRKLQPGETLQEGVV